MFRKKKMIPKLLFLLIVLLPCIICAEDVGLFPSLNQLFGTAMPSVGVLLERKADEIITAEDSIREVYHPFSVSEYDALGQYLAGTKAVLDDYSVEGTCLNASISVRGASMNFLYDRTEQTATVIYPYGTRAEMELENVTRPESILPPMDGSMPSAQFVINREPVKEEKEINGITQYYENFNDNDYNAFSTYLGRTGASLQNNNIENGVLSADIVLDGFSFQLVYDWNRKALSVYYPTGTNPEKQTRSILHESSPILPTLGRLGKELPRISQAIHREPNTINQMLDGGIEEVYNGFEEVDYEAFSQYLKTAGCTVDEYHMDDDGALVISLSNGSGSFMFIYNAVKHSGSAVYPGNKRIEVAWAPTPTPKPTSVPTATPRVIKFNYSESECWKSAENYLKSLKWHNPQSLVIYGYTSQINMNTGNYIFFVDYGAQVVAGGMKRSTYTIFVSAETGLVTSAYNFD